MRSIILAIVALVVGALVGMYVLAPKKMATEPAPAAQPAATAAPAAAPAPAQQTATAGAGQTLANVRNNGQLVCGINTGLPGFATPDDKGAWAGFDVDFCRAMSAAIFGDANKVSYKPLTGKTRFPALQSGEVDVLSRNTTWSFLRDVNLGFDFAGVTYYDGQGFIVRKSLGVKSAKELNNASVCIQSGTTTELNLADYFRANNITFTSVVTEDAAEARQNYEAGRCDAYTTDRSGLAAQRAVMQDPNEHVILPDVISKEPLAPAVRHGDNQWADIAAWTRNVLILAEEFGITSANVDQMKESPNPEIRRLLGVEDDYGTMLGLSKDWAYNIIKLVGNYGEIYDRHIGASSPLGLERGANALARDGGLLYSPPFR